MAEKKVFKASRQEYGDNVVKYMNKNIPLNSALRVGFDWGNTGAGARQLATAVLKEASNQTIARIYTTKYTNAIIKNLKKDNWTLTIAEVQKWINENTEYSVDEDNSQAEEEQRLKKEKLKSKQEDDRKKKEVEEIFQREKEKTEGEQKLKLKRDKEIKAKKEEETRVKKEKLEDDKKIKEELEALKKELVSAKEKVVKFQNDDFDDENIIENICNELDISQDKLGKILGVTRHTVQNWKLENEIPKLAKKAMEFYQQHMGNQNDVQLFEEEIQEYKRKATQSQDELDEYKEESKQTLIGHQDELDACKKDIEKYQDEINKYKDIEDLYSEEIDRYKQEIEKYKDIVSMLDIPSLYKRYSALNGVSKA